MKKNGYDMLYLTACGINGILPDKNKMAEIDINSLYQMCKFHSLTAIVAVALESVGISDSRFTEAKSKSIRKNMLLDAEREKICEYMEKSGIWYMSLKGVIFKELYPKLGMRQMSDNDILFDSTYQKQIYNFMKARGYKAEEYRIGNHDAYLKPPIYNYEMHNTLFGEELNDKLYNYYIDVKKRLIKAETDKGKEYSYRFTDEDFYIYITAHEYKHYSLGGTGLRSLLDCYVYLKAKGENLDWDYIKQELEKLGIADFERKSRQLAQKIFSTDSQTNTYQLPTLTEDESEMLEYYLFSGAYGTVNHSVKRKMEKYVQETGSTSKFRYLLHRLFPPMEFYKAYYPFFYKHKILLPIGWIFRFIRGLTVRRKKFTTEMSVVKKT